MEKKKVTVNDAADLMTALGDKERLHGYKPADKVDANTFKYPIIFILDEEAKTYSVEEEKEEVKAQEAPVVAEEAPAANSNPLQEKIDADKKKKKIGMIVGFSVLGVVVVVGIILAIYFGVK